MTRQAADRRSRRPSSLRRLLANARRARYRRHLATRTGGEQGSDATAPHSPCDDTFVTREGLVRGTLEETVQLSPYLTHLVMQQMLTTGSAATIYTSFDDTVVTRVVARSLAVVIIECLHMFDTCIRDAEEVRIYVAAALNNDVLIVGLRAEGVVDPVPSSDGMLALARASRIVNAIGGEFLRGFENARIPRGFENSRMVIGITLGMAGDFPF